MAKPSARSQRDLPAALGYRMPAEWEPHAATWMAWPHNRSDWPGKFDPIPWVFAEIIRHLSRVERVELMVQDEAEERRARDVLMRACVISEADCDPSEAPVPPRSAHGRLTRERRNTNTHRPTLGATGVCIHQWTTDRIWTRDYGPIFLRRDPQNGLEPQIAVGATNWRFNAWAKYDDWRNDDRIAANISQLLKLPEWQPSASVSGRQRRVVLEGGSIDVNGRGTLITTEECLLSEVQQRNLGFTRNDLERVFADYFGIRKVIWLERGIVGDDTHGHVDDITRFVAPDTVVTAVEPDPADPNHEPLRENLERLRRSTDQDGRPLRVVELPMPSPVMFRSQRLPASYANFYIANGIVLVPTFNDANDRIALNTLASVMPDRKIIGIYCGDLIWGLGAIHCMTQQQPK